MKMPIKFNYQKALTPLFFFHPKCDFPGSIFANSLADR